MSAVVRPPRHDRIHHHHECPGGDGGSARREGLQAIPNRLLRRLCGENVDGILPTTGTLAFHEVETKEIKPVGPENPNQLKVLTFDAARLAR
jgi:hypothetical protein